MTTVREDAYQPKSYLGVMVSSTFSDIREHRAEAIRIIEERQMLPRVMEWDSAKPEDVIASSLQMVRDSAAYVGVITHKYGQAPRCPARNPNGLSLTELEFNEAQRLGRPTLLFVMGDHHKGERSDFEHDPEKLAKLTAFQERAKRASPDGSVDRVYATFEDLDGFKAKMANAVAGLAVYLATQHLPPTDPIAEAQSIDQCEPRPEIFGREEELDRTVAALHARRPLIISGGPGVGKTAIAIATLYEPSIIERFGKRRVLVSFDEATEPRALLSRLASQLGLSATGDEASLLTKLETYASGRAVAAVLDNVEGVFEQANAEAERLLRLLSQLEGLSLIVTIRGVSPRVSGADYIDNLPKLGDTPAREAFLSVAGERFENDPDLPPMLVALEGHALSIQLVAAQAAAVPALLPLRQTWEEEHAMMLRRFGQEENRFTSVRASLALSLQSRTLQSAPLSRRLLSMLSLLPAGLQGGHLTRLLGERGLITRGRANEAASVLHMLKLIEPRLDGRLRLLNPIREAIKLDLPILRKDRRRLHRLYLEIAQRGHSMGTKRWSAVNSDFEREKDNLDPVCVDAVTWATDVRPLFQSLDGLANYGTFAGGSGTKSLEIAVEKLERQGALEHAASLMHRLGSITLHRVQMNDAQTYFTRGWKLGLASRSKIAQARSRDGLGQVAMYLSDLKTAEKEFLASLELSRSIDDTWTEANTLYGLGFLKLHEKDAESSRPYLETAREKYLLLGDSLGEANAIASLAWIDPVTAADGLIAAIAIYRSVGDAYSEANATARLGMAYDLQGDSEAAKETLQAAIDFARPVGNVPAEANALVKLGQILLEIGRSAEGAAKLRDGFELFLRILPGEDASKSGWVAFGKSTLEEDSAAAVKYIESAKDIWVRLGRYDLIRDFLSRGTE